MARLAVGVALAGLVGFLGCSNSNDYPCGSSGFRTGFIPCECSTSGCATIPVDSATKDAGPDGVPAFGDAALDAD